MLHNFERSLAISHNYSEAPWWNEIYKRAFNGLVTTVSVRQDGWAQRAGVDRVIVLKCGRIITVDEKVRQKDYGDIALERWSNESRKIPGWIQKPLNCDFIAYAVAPSKCCYLLPTLILQKAWRMYGRQWIKDYDRIAANNGSYVTVSVGVPVEILMSALSNAMLLTWS